jgi:FGGY family of carbohydrate kinases, N-terminal domain
LSHAKLERVQIFVETSVTKKLWLLRLVAKHVAKPSEPKMPRILSVDLGTTAAKVGVVQDGKILQASSAATHSYVVESAGEGRKEQEAPKILGAVQDALTSLEKALLASVHKICIADQMHGICFWRTGEEGTVSRLGTWEDRRVPLHLLASVNRMIAKASAGNPSPSFLHPGYGMATLASLLFEELVSPGASPALLKGHSLLSGHFNAAGTIGAWLVHHLSEPSPDGKVLIEVTDAASWGAFDLDTGCFLLEAVASGVADAVVESGSSMTREEARSKTSECLTRIFGNIKVVSASASLSLTDSPAPTVGRSLRADCFLGSFFRGCPTPPMMVQLSVGDHPASIVGALMLVKNKLEGQQAGRVVFVNCGTSLQAAVLVSDDDLKVISSSPLPDGCEVRPLFRMTESSLGKAKILLAASMNGGNVLAGLAHRYRAASAAASGDSSAITLDEAYAALEAKASKLLEIKEHGTKIHWPTVAETGGAWPYPSLSVLSPDGSEQAPTRFHPRVLPERRAILDVKEKGKDENTSVVVASPPATGASYACASLSLLFNACSLMLPEAVWRATDEPIAIVLTGSAFAKSRTLNKAAEILFDHLLGAGLYRIVHLTEEEAASCGALGAAATSFSEHY